MKYNPNCFIFHVLLFCAFCTAFCAGQPVPASAQPPAIAQSNPVVTPNSQPDLAMMMAFMKPESVVLRVGSMDLRWQELQPLTKQLIEQNTVNPDSDLSAALRALLQRIALRGLYLHEAKALDIQVSEEQRQANEQLLEQGLRNNERGISKDDIKKAFASQHSTLTTLTEEDAQRVVTMGNQLLDELTVSEAEINQQLAATKAVRDALAKQNELTRNQIRELLKRPDSNSDEGFARIAKEHSEGIEAKHGGVMNYAFLPSELAEVNDLEHWDLKPGQTSELMETSTAFRVMRVLTSIANDKKDEPERFRVAQWLFRKFPEDPETAREDIRAQMLLAKQKKAVVEIGKNLRSKYPVSCIFFPDGLWPAEEP
jgi:hypothetical protein